MNDLEVQARINSADIKKFKEAQLSLDASMIGIQDDLKELLSNSHALVKAFAVA